MAFGDRHKFTRFGRIQHFEHAKIALMQLALGWAAFSSALTRALNQQNDRALQLSSDEFGSLRIRRKPQHARARDAVHTLLAHTACRALLTVISPHSPPSRR
ncbi:MAG: hypothetical protein EB015_11375 [Methylocystaceae bacterium]|nr:hypothetical protein [Methylocystaceae bacterium]